MHQRDSILPHPTAFPSVHCQIYCKYVARPASCARHWCPLLVGTTRLSCNKLSYNCYTSHCARQLLCLGSCSLQRNMQTTCCSSAYSMATQADKQQLQQLTTFLFPCCCCSVAPRLATVVMMPTTVVNPIVILSGPTEALVQVPLALCCHHPQRQQQQHQDRQLLCWM